MGEAGWKQDPVRPERLRYFDGDTWTDHVAPGPDGSEMGLDPIPGPADPTPAADTQPPTEARPDPASAPAPEEVSGWAAPAAADTWSPPGAARSSFPMVGDDRGATHEPAPASDPTSSQGPPPTFTPAFTAEMPPVTSAAPVPTDDPVPSDDPAPSADPAPASEPSPSEPSPSEPAAADPSETVTPGEDDAPVWRADDALRGDAPARRSTGGRSTSVGRIVRLVLSTVGVAMLVFAAVQLILLSNTAGYTATESSHTALGWALLGATLWGVAAYSLRESQARRDAPGPRDGD